MGSAHRPGDGLRASHSETASCLRLPWSPSPQPAGGECGTPRHAERPSAASDALGARPPRKCTRSRQPRRPGHRQRWDLPPNLPSMWQALMPAGAVMEMEEATRAGGRVAAKVAAAAKVEEGHNAPQLCSAGQQLQSHTWIARDHRRFLRGLSNRGRKRQSWSAQGTDRPRRERLGTRHRRWVENAG